MKSRRALLPWTAKKTPVRVVVIGDLILDEYIDGQVSRISPEAPVPVHLVTGVKQTAGGAANTARNLQLAGGEALLLSVCGDDEAATRLKEILAADGIDTSNILTSHDRPTIRKVRVSSNHHQLMRIDWEKVHPISEIERDWFLRRIRESRFDGILVSDYGKGALPPEFIQQVMEIATERGVPVVVDPKSKDFSRYAGATVITPNRKEASEALGLGEDNTLAPEELGGMLRERYRLGNVLVTLGAKGMMLVRESNGASKDKSATFHLPALAREVFDVSGAGDTVAALMALGMAAGADCAEAMRFANLGAGRVVEKWGTQPITREELEDAIRAESAGGKGRAPTTIDKIINRDAISRVFAPRARRKTRIVFTNGCFDILHAGHVTYLEEARALGDILVVGLNTDESIARIKGPTRPVVALEHRARMLAGLQCVDYVIPFEEDTPLRLIEELLPHVLVKGADWAEDAIVGGDVVKSNGGQVKTITLVAGLSTTEVIKRIHASFKPNT